MRLDLSSIVDRPGESIAYSASVDLSDLVYGISKPVSEPVLASGTVRNTAGVLVMKGLITTCIHGVCDRCAANFDRYVEIPIDAVLVAELTNEENEDEWVFSIEADTADLDDIIRTIFVLNMDAKLLCKEDCAGLCHKCGKDLNDGPCACEKEPDPRFAALKQLLNKE